MTKILSGLGVEKDPTTKSTFRDVLNDRLKRGPNRWMNARTTLRHSDTKWKLRIQYSYVLKFSLKSTYHLKEWSR